MRHMFLIRTILLHGQIKFDSVEFRYPSRDEVTVLKDVSFSIEPGQEVALVGPSGAGKSTLVSLLVEIL